MPTMKSFAETFFRRFGAQVGPPQDGEGSNDELVVDLPPDLAEVFGKSRLYLVFSGGQGTMRELSPTEDLLVYGSRIFDQMLSLLAGRGEAVYLDFPARVSVDIEGQQPSPLPLHNCHIVENQTRTGRDQFYIFNFRAVYLSDEKQEEFMTIVLDAESQARPEITTMLAGLEALPPSEQPRQIEPEGLRSMLERAEETARRQVDKRAAKLEEAIHPRLEKVLLRLTSYYRRLADEVDTGQAAQDETVRADLQRDLTRKIAEELERHRLRVTLSPVSYAIASIPFAHYRLNLATRQTEQSLDLSQNLHTGQVESLACRHCRQPIEHLALCDRGHAVHPHCLDTCGRCERDTCRTCGIQPCAICDSPTCLDCVASCAHCDRWLCRQHVEICAICQSPYCSDHGFGCKWCGQIYCLSHNVDGACDTCRQVQADSAVEVFSVPPVAKLKAERYHWRQAENESYVVYLGRRKSFISPLLGRFVIVADKLGRVRHRQKIGPVRWYLEKRRG